ncbi:MAG: hypothetical protein ACD_67C00105G0001 [uncultured bacterium]|nr:MAG: hypothetical protein ACD_67C00105G0001 [uncultured bacterium]
MNSPQFKGDNTGVFNEEVCLKELREVDARSLAGLYISKALLFIGVILIVLNNLNVVAPGSYFGAMSWVTVIVFFIGLVINFVCIPVLYFSSLRNFKKESEFWDKETFWILPLFFFGTFFLYGAELSIASTILVISVIVVALTHIRFVFEARKTLVNSTVDSYASHGQYFMTLKYLTAYYVVLLVLLIAYNPLQHTFFWIRTNM